MRSVTALVMVVLLLWPAVEAERQVVHKVKQLGKKVHPETSKILRRLRPMLEKKRILQKNSEMEIRKLLEHPESELANHIIRRRRLRLRALQNLQDSVVKITTSFELLLKNFSTAGLSAGLHQRLRFLQNTSIAAASDAAEAEALAKEELRRIKTAASEKATGEESTLEGVISKVDVDIGHFIAKLERDNAAGVLFTKATESGDSQIETVVKMPEEGKSREDSGIVSHLLDNQGNQYVLSKPRDSFVHYEDSTLTQDIVHIVTLSFVCGCVARAAGLPLFFGYLVGGTLLSPSELNLLKSIVQVETLAQFGVYFLLFLLGVEFSLVKLRSVLRAAIFGGVLGMVTVIVLCVLSLTLIFRAPTAEGVLVGFCVSLSSTIVVMRMMTPREAATQYGQLLLAVLVIQDVCLGLMVASISILNNSAFDITLYLRLLFWLAVLCLATAVFSKVAAPTVLTFTSATQELFLLSLCTMCFVSMSITEYMGLSMEVGCFLSGVALSPHVKWVSRIDDTVRPLQEFFNVVFFSAIGIHISASFLMQEAVALCVITIIIVGTKWLCGFFIFRFGFDLGTTHASLVGLGLSQMSEFSFVIAAHGKAAGLINREVYFMLLGITILSLVITPVLWKFHPKPIPQGQPERRENVYTIAMIRRGPAGEKRSMTSFESEGLVWSASFEAAPTELPDLTSETVNEHLTERIIDAFRCATSPTASP